MLRFYPNMYVVLVGPSGSRGLKLASEAITREALIRELNTSSLTVADNVTGKITMHSSLTIFSGELTVFLGYQNKQLMSDLTDWYDCRDRWTYRTKLSGTDEIIGVWVNLIGGTTPELIQASMPLEAIGGGLTSRMIFIFEHRKEKREAVPMGDLELRRQLFHDMEIIFTLRGEYKYREDFLTKYSEWYLTENEPPFTDHYFSGYCERRANHILKLSMICNASRSSGDMVLNAEDFFRAKKLLEMAEVKMPFVFRGVGKNVLADVTERLLGLMAANKRMELSDVMNRFYKDVDRQSLHGVIATLETMGSIQVVYEGTNTYLKYLKGFNE